MNWSLPVKPFTQIKLFYFFTMKITGIGVDITRISRFNRLLSRYNEHQLISKILSIQEFNEFNLLPTESKPKFLSVRWALKEALYKAGLKSRFPEISITKLNGKPITNIEPKSCMLSVSHDGDIVVANAIVFD